MQSPTKTPERSHWLAKFLVPKVILGCIILALLTAVVLSMKNHYENQEQPVNLGFKNLGILVTQECRTTVVNVTEASREILGVEIPFTQSKYIYSYDVVVKAGYDFNEIDCTPQEDKIIVTLPPPEIMESAIDEDSFQVYYEEESAFRHITMSENSEARSEMIESAVQTATNNGLLENAEENAKTILTAFIGQSFDLQKYTIEFKSS